MTRAAAFLALAAIGLGGCRVVTLNFDPPDAATARCTADRDCPLPSLHCDHGSGLCLACVSDTDCTSSARPRCDSALHICVQCGGSQDCPAASKCDPTTRTCVRMCAIASDCPAASSCDDGFCAQCDDDHGCTGPRTICDPATRQCTNCVVSAQCTTATAPVCDRTSGQCVGCLTATDCATGESCDPTDWTCKATGP